MSESVIEVINKCINARKGKDLFKCNNDYCKVCSVPRTMFFCDNCKDFLQGCDKPLFITILLGPIKSYSIGIRDAKCAIRRLNELGIKCIGVFEVATKDDTKERNWSNFMKHTGYDEERHIGIGHLHIIARVSANDELRTNFFLSQQVVIKVMGTGFYSRFSMDNNIDTVDHYMRKREGDRLQWLDQTKGSAQLCFRTDRDCIEILGDKSYYKVWYKVGQEWGESFTRLQNRWINGSMESRKSDETIGMDSEVDAVRIGESGDKGEGLFGRNVSKSAGMMVKDGSTKAQEIKQGKHNIALELIKKVHEKRQIVSPTTIKIIEKQEEPKYQNPLFDLGPPIKDKPAKKKKPTLIETLVLWHNEDNIIQTGKCKGLPVKSLLTKPKYITSLLHCHNGEKNLRRMIDNALPPDEHIAKEEAINAKRMQRATKIGRAQTKDLGFIEGDNSVISN